MEQWHIENSSKSFFDQIFCIFALKVVVRRSDNGGIFLICHDVCESLSVFQQTIAVRAGVVWLCKYCAAACQLSAARGSVCSSRSPPPGSAPAAAPAMVTLVMSNSTSIYAICVKSNMIKHSNKLFPPETLPPRSLLSGSFGSLLKPNCQSSEVKVFQTSVPVSVWNNFIHNINNINIEELYCLLFVNPDTRDWRTVLELLSEVSNIWRIMRPNFTTYISRGLETQRKRTGNSKLVTSWHRNCNTKQFGDNV